MSYTHSFSSLGCPESTLDEVLALARKHSIPSVELRTLEGTVDLPAYFEKRYGSPEKLATHVGALGIGVQAFDTSLYLIGSDEEKRRQFLQFVPWAEALGVKWLRVFDGGKTGSDAEFAEAAQTVAWWRGLREEHKWKTDIMIETHDLLFTEKLINRFLEIAPATAILWDSHHTWKRGGEDPVATWRRIKNSVVHVHVKDSVSQPSARHPFTYVLPGDGEFPMAPLKEVLEGEYTGPVSFEWERMWHPYLAPVDDALRVAAERKWW